MVPKRIFELIKGASGDSKWVKEPLALRLPSDLDDGKSIFIIFLVEGMENSIVDARILKVLK